MAADVTLDPSTLLDGRYRLGELLGHGGMADVYRATDEVLGRDVAVKLLREVSETGHRERFVAEARVLAGLDHPGLVTLLDAGIQSDRPYLVMALADGPTLSSRIATGPLDPDEVRVIGLQLAHGLDYAHRRGVVHRDVKPSNVLLCDGDRVLLADFGIARLIGSTEQQTRTGDTIGSPAYLAPEQVAGEDLTPAVDVYSLGLVLLEALTATRAFPGAPVEAAVARLNAAPPMPTSLDPSWRTLLARMTHREPANRPTAAEVAEELAAGAGAGRGAAPAATGSWAPRAVDPAEATGEITMESPIPVVLGPDVAGPEEHAAAYRVAPDRRRTAILVAAVVLGLAVLAVVQVTALGGPSDTGEPASRVPDGVPVRYQEPLGELHELIHGEAR